MYCPNVYCALGCADGDYQNRTKTYYKTKQTQTHQVDFNFCHPLGQKHYIGIDLTNTNFNFGLKISKKQTSFLLVMTTSFYLSELVQLRPLSI